MPRKKKKHHARRVIKPAKAHRNKILNRDLDAAYNHFCGTRLHSVLVHLESISEDCTLAKGYYLALKCEIANRRAKKHKGDMRAKLYREKVKYLLQLISHCQLYNYRIERAVSYETGGPSNIVYCYLPGCEQISWHASIGKLPIPEATDDWDEKKFTTLKKLEEGLKKEFYFDSVPT